jgi:peptidoglycan/xylan/chitin deacetylase (PgdA/CDA1 family)
MRTAVFCQRTLFTIFLVCTILSPGCSRKPIEEKQVNVVFRFDDYSARSSTEMELRIIDAFRKNEASITFGVIPFVCAGDAHDPSPQDIVPLTSKKGDILKTGFEDGILDIALHGYSHQTINAKNMMELSSLDYNIQVERLVKGKKLLEGMIDAPVTTFVPPWDQYDLNTLRALEVLGFSTLSAAKNGEATEDSKLNFLPASCDLPRLRDVVKAARSSSDNQPLIVVLFHQYDFREIDEKHGSITIQEFYDLLNWLKSQRDLRLLSISQATKVIKDLSANRFLLTKRNYSLYKFLPSSLWEESMFLYQESPVLPKTLLKVGGFYLMIVILGTVLSFSIGCLVFPRSAFIMNIGTFGSIVLSAIILVYAFHDLQVHPKGMVVSAGVIGASIGLCICFQYLKRKRILIRNSVDEKGYA